MKVCYDDGAVILLQGDCRDFIEQHKPERFGVLVTDPPYGIDYKSGQLRHDLPNSIQGDEDTTLRDEVLGWWGDRPALVFGSWKTNRPALSRARLIWDTKGALGMGALDLPWKPADQEIYVIGRGFHGHRGNNVLSFPPVQSMARNGREHPHEKPVDLLRALLLKCPPGVIFDPFAGVGTVLRAAKDLGRQALGIEIEADYCEAAARRLGQEVLEVA